MTRPNESTIHRVKKGRWFWPEKAQRAHFFAPSGISLCRHWRVDFKKEVLTSDYGRETMRSPLTADDCTGCRERVDQVVQYIEEFE